MNVQQWAVLFIALVSFDYAAATFFGSYYGVDKSYANDDETYYGWSERCRCNDGLKRHLDNTLERIRTKMGKSHGLLNLSLGEYEFENGRVVGLNKFKRNSPYRCSLTNQYARIFFRISFLKLVVHYKLSLLEDVLNNLLGGIGCYLSNILGNVAGFLFRVLLPEAHVTVILRVNFDGSGGIVLEGFHLAKINEVSFLNKKFSRHSRSLSPYFKPLMDHSLRNYCRNDLRGHFSEYLETCTARKEMFYYESQSSEEYDEECEEEEDCE